MLRVLFNVLSAAADWVAEASGAGPWRGCDAATPAREPALDAGQPGRSMIASGQRPAASGQRPAASGQRPELRPEFPARPLPA